MVESDGSQFLGEESAAQIKQRKNFTMSSGNEDSDRSHKIKTRGEGIHRVPSKVTRGDNLSGEDDFAPVIS